MRNIFLEYPEFINTDVRTNRLSTKAGGYNINSDFQYHRHNITIPEKIVAGASVLDLGCCIGATGAWVLSAGAKRYVGVELQSNFCKLANQHLSTHFAKSDWQITQASFTDFFNTNKEQFDIVIAFGVLYQSIHFSTLLDQLASVSTDRILIDSIEPFAFLTKDADLIEKIKNIPAVEYKPHNMVGDMGKNYTIESALPNLFAVQVNLRPHDFYLESDYTADLTKLFPGNYQQRYAVSFKKNKNLPGEPGRTNFEIAYTDPEKQVIIDFNKSPAIKNQVWKFDADIADQFDHHARQHIPNYDAVIDQSVQLCKKLIPTDGKVVDVGCAVGETIKRLYGAGFRDLVGVDASNEMLDKVQHLDLAQWVHSNVFPSTHGPFDAILCNWTLHFINEKIQYINDMYKSLAPGGILILTDKTANSGIELELYHDFKRSRGVTESDILKKAEAVKDIMFINSPVWYMQNLCKAGFDQVSIIDAAPCFTTFLAIKNQLLESL